MQKILRFYKKKNFDWAIIGGDTIFPRSLKTTQANKSFQARANFFFFFKSYMTPLYLLIIVFPKFDPLTATGMS